MWRIVKRVAQRITNTCLGNAREPDEIMIQVKIPVDIWGHWHAGADLGMPTRDLLISALTQIADDETKTERGQNFLWKSDGKETDNDKWKKTEMHWMQEIVPGEVYRKCSENLKNEDGSYWRYPTPGQIVAAAVMQSNEWNRSNGPADAQFTSGALEAGTSGKWTGTVAPPGQDR